MKADCGCLFFSCTKQLGKAQVGTGFLLSSLLPGNSEESSLRTISLLSDLILILRDVFHLFRDLLWQILIAERRDFSFLNSYFGNYPPPHPSNALTTNKRLFPPFYYLWGIRDQTGTTRSTQRDGWERVRELESRTCAPKEGKLMIPLSITPPSPPSPAGLFIPSLPLFPILSVILDWNNAPNQNT